LALTGADSLGAVARQIAYASSERFFFLLLACYGKFVPGTPQAAAVIAQSTSPGDAASSDSLAPNTRVRSYSLLFLDVRPRAFLVA
jgi:hypothetical protein